MANVWDIAQHVENHPDDSEQRWRLAKKLYKACEYRLALEHLQVLKNDGDERLNVRRYLGACYFRLGRYDEASTEVAEAIALWPDELPLYEQQARVHKMAGRRLEALATWEKIAERFPDHPTAERAIERLKHEPGDTPEEELNIHDSDAGIDIAPGKECMVCGAQNSTEFELCWQCHSPLVETMASGAPARAATAFFKRDSKGLTLTAGLATVALLGFGLYQALMGLSPGDAPATTLGALLARETTLTRLVAGGAILVFWPIVLYLSIMSLAPQYRMGGHIIRTALLLASGLFAALWLPGPHALYGLGALILASIVLLPLLLRPGAKASIGAWVVLWATALGIGFGAVALINGTQPLAEMNAICRYAAQQSSPQRADHTVPLADTPVTYELRWVDTGSDWLTNLASRAELLIVCEGRGSEPATLELTQGAETIAYRKIRERELRLTIDEVQTGRPYRLSITSPEPASVTVNVKSVIKANINRLQ